MHMRVVYLGGISWYSYDSTVGFLLLQRFSIGLAIEYSSCFISVLNLDLYVVVYFGFDHFTHFVPSQS